MQWPNEKETDHKKEKLFAKWHAPRTTMSGFFDGAELDGLLREHARTQSQTKSKKTALEGLEGDTSRSLAELRELHSQTQTKTAIPSSIDDAAKLDPIGLGRSSAAGVRPGRECTTWFTCNGDLDTFFSWLTGTSKRYHRAITST